jgi:site-specific DNA-methyltransferase (adenine-specific)
MSTKIIKDDVIHFAETYKGEKFHALLCDPPYHLTSVVKRFGKKNSAPAKFGSDGAFARASKGFMGQEWDGGDIAFDPKTWKAFFLLMHQGAFGIAFASARGWHRLACAIEDAGFIIHPMIGWIYGQGFPKAHRVGKNKIFKDHRYGLQALKPALEPIIVFQRPYNGKPMNRIIETGAGTLNIGGCRVAGEDISVNVLEKWSGLGQEKKPKYKATKNTLGRWPANLVHDGSNEVISQFPITQSGRSNGKAVVGEQSKNIPLRRGTLISRTDDGSAARFFYAAKASKREKNAGCEQILARFAPTMGDGIGVKEHNPETATLKHNFHPTVKPLALCKWLATMLMPPDEYEPRRLFVPFAGSGSEMIGADIAGWESIVGVEFMPEYVELAKKRIAYWHNHKGDIK